MLLVGYLYGITRMFSVVHRARPCAIADWTASSKGTSIKRRVAVPRLSGEEALYERTRTQDLRALA
jgi:hypothetical protein